jgi:hypothetical protein
MSAAAPDAGQTAACGESPDTLAAHVVTIDLDDVPLRALDLEGLLKTKRNLREKDRVDRVVLERAIEALRRDKAADDRWAGARRCAACCSQRHRGP